MAHDTANHPCACACSCAYPPVCLPTSPPTSPWSPPHCPQAASFVRAHLFDEATGRLRRAFMRGPSAVQGFADDYAFLIAGGAC